MKFLACLVLLAATIGASARDYTALLGTYTQGGSRGLYLVRLNGDTGALSAPELVAELPNPEFLALHPGGRLVYALTQVKNADGKSAGAVAAFALDPATGRLTLLNTEATGRGGLTHLAVDATGRMVVAASYGGGYVVSFPLQADGRLGPAASLFDQAGPLGPKSDRQNAPHPHSVTLSPDNRFAFIADLGVDRVFAYALAPETGTLALHPAGAVTIAPGSGPRHTKFSPDGKNFYVLDELDGTVTACRYDTASGVAEPFQRVSTTADDYTGRQSCSEIRLHPGGRFVYAANRGNNTIAVFARDPATGALTRLESVPTGGKNPRNFNLTPDGALLVCGHQDTDNVTVFRVDPASGRLSPTANTVTVPKAICVLFLP